MRSQRTLLVVRHAPAEDSSRDGDVGRALTAAGREEMADAARGLARLVDALDVIATSPLVRARQTADLVAERFPDARREVLPELAPGMEPDDLAAWLEAVAVPSVAVVGHEPDLSRLVGWLLGGQARVRMRKGAVAALSLGPTVVQGTAELDWLVTRGALRRIGTSR
jgi:phosphohistidine phosphatase